LKRNTRRSQERTEAFTMNILRTLSFRASVLLFAALAVLTILVLSTLAFANMRVSEALAERVLVDVKLTHAAGTADMMHDALRGDVLAAQVAGTQAPEERKKTILADVAKHTKTMEQELSTISSSTEDPAVIGALGKVRPAVGAYTAAAAKLVQAALDGKLDPALQADFDKSFGQLEDSLAGLSGLIEATATANVASQAAMFSTERWVMGLAALFSTLLLVLFGWAFARTTLKDLGAEPRALRGFSLRIAQGALDARLAQPAPADSVADAMLRMQCTLADTVGGIRTGAESVATAIQQLAQGNRDLNQRTVQQAATLQDTAASMEQLSATVRQNADNARQASQLALGASTVATKGGAVVGRVVETMKGINDSSNKIADIISVIDGIAFQTNILALNAAVEAARAGEQGRGFAVVATEVRSLAGRSAQAAREIKGLIKASVERVELGAGLVNEAGATMSEILTSIKTVTSIMGEISTATAEQSAGIAQVGQAVTQMDRATQQNAALVEQSAAAAEAVLQQAGGLVKAVAVFTGADAGRAGAAA
jgi:methyl-accepting chemotaxis protein